MYLTGLSLVVLLYPRPESWTLQQTLGKNINLGELCTEDGAALAIVHSRLAAAHVLPVSGLGFLGFNSIPCITAIWYIQSRPAGAALTQDAPVSKATEHQEA